MAQEILVDTLSVGIEQLKPIHNWALVMTTLVTLNPDQEH